MKFGKYLFGLLSGLTFGILFAPEKGEDLRKEVAKKANLSGIDGFKTLGNALLDAGSEAYGEFQELSKNEQVKALKDLSKEKLDDLLKIAQGNGYDVASKVQEKLEEVASLLEGKKEKVEKKAKKVVLATKKKAKKAKKEVEKKIMMTKKAIRKTAKKKKKA
ncbi:hypothetical protein COY07_02215 [Candidatus Peregrinibacteria bacterium CG_4_10_14_0_2_um_filter_43_11]|nr:MAG: hypothetical protein COY07_02215 [Candidatus Peregrinibacteria bacterium CG_4_10_14_0_2_um_filter_43_11]